METSVRLVYASPAAPSCLYCARDGRTRHGDDRHDPPPPDAIPRTWRVVGEAEGDLIEVGTVLRLDAVERGFVELQTHDYLEYLFTVLDGPQAGTCYVIAVTTESMPPGRPGERWHYADQTLYPANLVPVPESTIPDWDRRIEPVKRPVVVIEPTPVQITFAQADCDAVEAAFGRPLGGFWPGHLSVRGEPVVDVSLAKALDLLEKLRRQHVLATGIRFPDWMPPRDAEALLAAAGTSARRIPAVGSRRPRDGVAAAIRRWLAS